MTCAIMTREEMLHVLRSTCVCYAAMSGAEGPYVVPLCFHLLEEGAPGEVLLMLQGGGTALGLLRQDLRVCLAFSMITGARADSVLMQGEALVGQADAAGCTPVAVKCLRMTGRRFPLPLDVPLTR